MLHYGPSNRVDPVLLLLLRVGDEIHGVVPRRQLESELLVENILGSLDGEAGGHWNDATRRGGARDVGILEPEELPLFQNEPPAPPCLDVLALLGEPPGAFWVRPELDAVVLV